MWLAYHFIAFGLIGQLIEVWFTGIWSLFHKNPKATSTSYLWMLLVYGSAGLQLEALHGLGWFPLVMACIYVPVIYFNEFVWGWAIHKLIKRRLWDYGVGKHTLMGYVNWGYAPLWFLLALGFDLYLDLFVRVFRVINTVL